MTSFITPESINIMLIFRFTTGINISYQGDGEEAQLVDRTDMAWRACQVAGAG